MLSNKEQEPSWLEQELGDVSLGDKRLDWRLLDTGSKLAAQPGVPVNQACDDWADTKASYRLFANKKTKSEKILLPHQKRTVERIQGHERVLLIQDTSLLDYSHHPQKQGVGPIGTEQQKQTGFVMHSTLATTDTGLPLGVLGQNIWSRPEQAKKLSAKEKRTLPIEQKESYKWLSALSETVGLLPEEQQAVTICDSEGDIFELFAHARSLQTDLLVRAAQNRCVSEPEVGHLWTTLEKQQIAGHLNVQVPARNGEPQREAIVSVRFAAVTLKCPIYLKRQKKLPDIPLYAVLVQEVNPADTVASPLCWLLLTTVPVLSFEDAIERIHWYRQRWQIEVYHKVLKSGCRVEESRLSTDDRLRPFIALLTIIAWRLFWLTHIARQQPDEPCTTVLADHEWRALYAYQHKSTLTPQSIPSVAQVTLWIAQLGGFLARKSDGQPGVTFIWRGWQRLNDISASWLIFHPI